MQTDYIYNLKGKTVPETIGAKAKNLRFLAQKSFAVPETFVCTWDAYQNYLHPNGFWNRFFLEIIDVLSLHGFVIF